MFSVIQPRPDVKKKELPEGSSFACQKSRNLLAPLCKGRDALSKQSGGLFVAKAGHGSDLGRCQRS